MVEVLGGLWWSLTGMIVQSSRVIKVIDSDVGLRKKLMAEVVEWWYCHIHKTFKLRS